MKGTNQKVQNAERKIVQKEGQKVQSRPWNKMKEKKKQIRPSRPNWGRDGKKGERPASISSGPGLLKGTERKRPPMEDKGGAISRRQKEVRMILKTGLENRRS